MPQVLIQQLLWQAIRVARFWIVASRVVAADHIAYEFQHPCKVCLAIRRKQDGTKSAKLAHRAKGRPLRWQLSLTAGLQELASLPCSVR